MDAWELSARERLRDLVAEYAHAADRGRFDEVAALFADDGVLELPDGRTMTGPVAIRAFLAHTGGAVRAIVERPIFRHHVTSHRVIVESPAVATGHAYFLVMTERGPDHWGRYADRYVASGDGWRFASRRVRVDGRTPDSVTARAPS